ncbi:hypothetical protein OS493_008023 [Desmophyllum pertusum]|uniref:SAM domain-containing protein n=1 Tax=Desmophyllum pertusum TaxID=174260 RepID=A0A9X0CGB6_9CNID|nr:hypothetical protein OS493_008023 [Desmophyllum pertusum]
MITDVATLKAAREEDLKACGLKMGEIIKIRKALDLQQDQLEDGCNREEQSESEPTDISLLQSSYTSSEHSHDHMDVDESKQVYCTKH